MFGATQFYVLNNGSNSGWNATTPATWVADDYIEFDTFSVPISGWTATDIVTPEASISGQARYTTNASQTITTSSVAVPYISFEDKDYDINNEVIVGASASNGVWEFKAKSSGHYQYNVSVLFASASWAAGTLTQIQIFKNGSQYSRQESPANAATGTQYMPAWANGVIYLAAGDTLAFKLFQNTGGSINLYLDGLDNYVSIAKLSGTGNQSFYISSPLKADPATNTIKAKNNSGTDVLSIDGATEQTALSGNLRVGSLTNPGTPLGRISYQSPISTDKAFFHHVITGAVNYGLGVDSSNLFSIGTLNGVDSWSVKGATMDTAGGWIFPLTGIHIFGNTSTAGTTQLQIKSKTGNLSQVDMYSGTKRYSLVLSDTASTGYTAESLALYNGSGYTASISKDGLVEFPINGIHSYGSNGGGDNSTTLRIQTTDDANNRNAALQFRHNTTTKWEIKSDGSNDRLTISDVDGAQGVYLVQDGASGWTNFSDIRLKTDIVPITKAIDAIKSVDTFSYRMKTGSKPAYGVSAQSLLKAGMSYAVDQTDPEKLGVTYTGLIPWALAAIKEQQVQIECLVNADTKKQRQACVGVK